MKWTPALIVGLALAVLASPASAQWRDDHRGGPSAQRGPGSLVAPHGYPAPPHGYPAPPHGYPPPMQRGPVYRGPPQQGPGPNYGDDSLGANWGSEQDVVRQGVNQRRFVPLGQAIASIRRRGAGRELDAGLEQWNGRPAYRVRWAAANGRRMDYIVDAESGAILTVEGGP